MALSSGFHPASHLGSLNCFMNFTISHGPPFFLYPAVEVHNLTLDGFDWDPLDVLETHLADAAIDRTG